MALPEVIFSKSGHLENTFYIKYHREHVGSDVLNIIENLWTPLI